MELETWCPTKCTCIVEIKSGKRIGERCGKPCKNGKYCGLHK